MFQAPNILIASMDETDTFILRLALGLLLVTLLLYCVLPRRRYNRVAVILTIVWAIVCVGRWAISILDSSLNLQPNADPQGEAVKWAASGIATIWGLNALSRALREGARLDESVPEQRGFGFPVVTRADVDPALQTEDEIRGE